MLNWKATEVRGVGGTTVEDSWVGRTCFSQPFFLREYLSYVWLKSKTVAEKASGTWLQEAS